MQKPAIGRIVQYRIGWDQDQPNSFRPLLVTQVWSDTCVNGIVFLDGLNDSTIGIGGTNLGNCQVWVTSVSRGDYVGGWRFHDDPPVEGA